MAFHAQFVTMQGENLGARLAKRKTSAATLVERSFDWGLQRLCGWAIVPTLSACAVTPLLVYTPADVPITIDKCAVRYSARLFEKDGVALDLLVDSATGPFRGKLQISIPQGQTARFLDTRVTMTGPSGSSSQSFESWSPWCQAPDRISGPRQPFCVFTTLISDLQGLVVTVPPLEINGSRYDVTPIRFSQHGMLQACWLSA